MGRFFAVLFTPRAVAVHLVAYLAGAGALLLAAAAPVWLLVGWGALVGGHYLAERFRRFIGFALEGYVEPPPEGGIVLTGSLSSSVVLDFDRGTAEKTYGGGRRLVRWLYRFCFQAPFPYTSNSAALEAAMHRRTVIGLLTQYWFGRNLVAPVLAVRPREDGRYTLVTELVRGTVPTDRVGANALMRDLTARFLESGLPSWQVGYYNPRAIGNLIQREDGTFSLIDLESNLVTPLVPPRAMLQRMRCAQYPSFDDIVMSELERYLDVHRADISAALGPEDTRRLFDAADAYGRAQAAWFASEPRIPSKVLSSVVRAADVTSWARAVRGLAARGQGLGEQLVRDHVDTWEQEGRLEPERAQSLRAALGQPEVALVLANLGAHLAITVPLRFPFGALTRFGWTAGSRVAAEWRALWRRQPATTARRVHTIPVMLATLLPSVGSGAYLLATPLRSHIALEVIALDRLLRRVPFAVYARLHLSDLMTWFAWPKPPLVHGYSWGALGDGLRARFASLAPRRTLALSVMTLNAGMVSVGAVIAQRYEAPELFEEHGLIATVTSIELLMAGLFGVAAFREFWQSPTLSTTLQDRAGSFFWGLSGLGLVFFAADDMLSIHERIGRWFADHFIEIPLFTNNVDDIITMGFGLVGLVCLRLFRHEVLAIRPASALYLGGVVAAAVMLLVDAYGRGPLPPVEFPAQATAVTLLFVAHLVYYGAVRQHPRDHVAVPAGAAASTLRLPR